MNIKPTEIRVISGEYFDFEADDYVGISLEVISYALSRMSRFNAHTKGEPYSVAQHSVYVSRMCDPEDALYGLLHDASEAYIADIVLPAKRILPEYRDLEDKVQRRILRKFGVEFYEDGGMPPSVKNADGRMCVTECRDLMHPTEWKYWMLNKKPYGGLKIDPWHWKKAQSVFINRFFQLTHLKESNEQESRRAASTNSP